MNGTLRKFDLIDRFYGDKGQQVILKIFIRVSIMMFLLSLSVNSVFAVGSDTVENLYFSLKIPNNWTYREFSQTPQAETTGFGPINDIELAPNEFSDLLLGNDYNKIFEKIRDDGDPLVSFFQDAHYPLKNTPLESYVKYRIDNSGITNITSQQYTTVGNVKAVRIDESPNVGNTKVIFYFLIHDNRPYQISYIANTKDYEKYLPEFENMVKSFRLVGGPDFTLEAKVNEAEDNQTQEQIQVNNIIKRLVQERLGLTNMQDIQNLQDQYDSQKHKDPDDITLYLCIQVDKNSTQRVCKYWNNDELRPVLLKIISEDDELNNLLRQAVQDSINKAFNESQNYSSEK